MRWRLPVLTALILLTLGMATLFVSFCLLLSRDGAGAFLLLGATAAGLLTLFGVWVSERCYRNL
jgi:hypothetical protein